MKYLFVVFVAFCTFQGISANTIMPVQYVRLGNIDTTRPVSDTLAGIDSTLNIKDSTTTYPSNNSGGRVQVKGYYRKNGTYVKPYTRSAPRSHH